MNNFTYEDIVAALHEGVSPDDIARSLTDNLNKAQEQVAAEKKAAKEAENAEQKYNLIEDLRNAFNNYGAFAFHMDEEDFLSHEEVEGMIDNAFSTTKVTFDLLESIFGEKKEPKGKETDSFHTLIHKILS